MIQRDSLSLDLPEDGAPTITLIQRFQRTFQIQMEFNHPL